MHFFNKVLKKLASTRIIGLKIVLLLISTIFIMNLEAQPPNYSTWHFKDGNLSATKRNNPGYMYQNIDSFIVKWSTPYISGDVVPLIGNIKSNSFSGVSDTEPLEIVALMGDELILINGAGKLIKRQKLPSFALNVKSLTALFDSTDTGFSEYTRNTVLIGSESIEYFDPNKRDTLAHSYIFGYDTDMDSLKVVKRLSIDLREFKPNVSCSIKPFYGRRVNGKLMVYSIIDMEKPIINANNNQYQYFRGFAQFYDDDINSVFPLPDVKDQKQFRFHIAGDVGLYQPSVKLLANNFAGALLPYQQINTHEDTLFKKYSVIEQLGGANYSTHADSNYIVGFNITNTGTASTFSPIPFTPNGNRPIIRPVYAELTDANGTLSRNYMLVLEQYSGIDSSVGTAKIHLYNAAGSAITSGSRLPIPALTGSKNHYWSVAVGNVDGKITNFWEKYYPNNRGNEIIITQSTKESVIPENRLFVMRYNNGNPIIKPTPSGDTLYPFDTIATSRVNGWLAAVSDIDLNDDGKDEILLVDGSKLMILRMRDYKDINFRLGYPFDTVMVQDFKKQTISNVSIADLEGDGKTDIIVTTFDSTYVLGSLISNTITMDCPQKSGSSSFCVNDTIQLRWTNVIISQPKLRLKFERFVGGVEVDTLIIDDEIDNQNDTINYSFIAGLSLFEGTNSSNISGRFILEGLVYPDKLYAESCIIEVDKPKLTITTILPDSIMVGDILTLNGETKCAAVVSAYIFNSTTTEWDIIESTQINNDIYQLNYTIPCISDMFYCYESIMLEKYINLMFVTEINGIQDTLSINGFKVVPKFFDISIDPKLTADPSLIIRWDINSAKSLLPCDKIGISASDDNGNTFNQISLVDINAGFYKWEVPYNISDNLIIRVCCDNYQCLRTDTAVSDVTPKYVNIIAPNPFNPNIETMEYVYKIDKSSNVTVKIFDQSNRLVKLLLNNASKNQDIVYTDRWDGTNENGLLVANGLYYLVFELPNGKREIHQVFVAK